MQQNFRIRMIGLKLVPGLFQLLPKLHMIVNFAVKSDHQSVIDGLHRLSAAGQIDNRESPMPEEDLVSGPESIAVRTAMAYPSGHLHQMFPVSLTYESGDSAHKLSPYVGNLKLASADIAVSSER
jgi:hypothetical protein